MAIKNTGIQTPNTIFKVRVKFKSEGGIGEGVGEVFGGMAEISYKLKVQTLPHN